LSGDDGRQRNKSMRKKSKHQVMMKIKQSLNKHDVNMVMYMCLICIGDVN
jgi:hypothetical protein